MNSRYEFRSPRNPYRHKQHLYKVNLDHWPDLDLDFDLTLTKRLKGIVVVSYKLVMT